MRCPDESCEKESYCVSNPFVCLLKAWQQENPWHPNPMAVNAIEEDAGNCQASTKSSKYPCSSTNRCRFPVLLARFWATRNASLSLCFVWNCRQWPNWSWYWIKTFIAWCLLVQGASVASLRGSRCLLASAVEGTAPCGVEAPSNWTGGVSVPLWGRHQAQHNKRGIQMDCCPYCLYSSFAVSSD